MRIKPPMQVTKSTCKPNSGGYISLTNNNDRRIFKSTIQRSFKSTFDKGRRNFEALRQFVKELSCLIKDDLIIKGLQGNQTAQIEAMQEAFFCLGIAYCRLALQSHKKEEKEDYWRKSRHFMSTCIILEKVFELNNDKFSVNKRLVEAAKTIGYGKKMGEFSKF